MFEGGIIIDYTPRMRLRDKDVVRYVRQAKVGIYVPRDKRKDAEETLKALGFEVVNKDLATGYFDESIIASLLIPIEDEIGIPLGIDLSGDHLVMLPLKRILVYGINDYRLLMYLANNIEEVCWMDSRGFRKPLEMNFNYIDKIPLGSATRRILSELSRVIASLTIGERFSTEILSMLTGGGEELLSDEEIAVGGREAEALREVLARGVLSRERGKLRGRVYIDIQQLSPPAMLSAIAAALLTFSGLVIINSDAWNRALIQIINHREGIIWVSRNPAMQLLRDFELRVYKEGDYWVLSRLVKFENYYREIRERFIPLWESK